MDKKVLIAGLVAALGLVYYWTSSDHHSAPATPVADKTKIRPKDTTSAATLNDKTLSKVLTKKSAKIEKKEIPSEESCHQFAKSRSGSRNSQNSELSLNRCLWFLHSTNFMYRGRPAKMCLNVSPTSINLHRFCLEMARGFLATINVLDSDQKQWEQMDTDTLLTAMNSFQENYTDSQAGKFAEFIQHMSKRLPENGAVAKAALIPLTANTQAEAIDHLRQNIEKARRLNPNDSEVLGAEMFLAVTTGEKNTLSNLETFNRENQDSGLGHAYAASIYHANGRPDLARNALQEARRDQSPHVQKLVKMGQDAMDGKSDKVGLVVVNGVVVSTSTHDFHKWVKANN